MSSIETGSSHTNWALISEARGDGIAAARALEQLVKRYWPAVYAFIRQTGRSVDESADLTQGFICEVMIARNLFDKADQSRGRFRSFLLTTLSNFLKDQHRTSRAKRLNDKPMLRFDEAELIPIASSGEITPEQAFIVQWHATLVRRVLERVRDTCIAGGLEAHWRVFEGRIVKPMLFGEQVTPYPKLVELLDLDDSSQASNMMVTVKRRFVRALIEEVGCTVDDPMQVEEELRALLQALEARS